MIRELLCVDCGYVAELNQEDKSNGWMQRKVKLNANLPKDLNIEFHVQGEPVKKIPVTVLVCDHCIPKDLNIEFHFQGEPVKKIPVTVLVCDHCNDTIPDGHEACARTLWDTNKEGTPGNWETEYGELI